MAGSASNGVWQVGEWRVDPSDDTISRNGETIKLEPRTMRLLICLAESAGSVVGIDRLLSEVWSGVVVGPASVYQSVSYLRKLLRDTDSPPTYIATVARKGYRLVAAARWVAGGEVRAGADSSVPVPIMGTSNELPVAAVAAQPSKRRNWGLVGAVAVGLVALTVIVWSPITAFLNRPPEAATLVVLPFVNCAADEAKQAFCDGLTEEISSGLALVPTLRVISHTSAFSYRGTKADIKSIGSALKARYAVEGSYSEIGDRIRVKVYLTDTRDGFTIAPLIFDRKLTDAARLQQEIADAVARNLELRLTPESNSWLALVSRSDPRAYSLYVLARQQLQTRTRESNDRAVDLFKRALDIDSGFALAQAGLAQAYINEISLSEKPVEEVTAYAEPLIASALKKAPRLSVLYSTRGLLRLSQSRLEDALRDWKKAAELNPSDVDAFSGLGRAYLMSGRPGDALNNYTLAAALEPLDSFLQARRCLALQDMARFDEAEEACKRARALQPMSAWGAVATSMLERSRGRLDEALLWNAEALRLLPGNSVLRAARADLLLTLGMLPAAAEELRLAESQGGYDENNNLSLDSPRIYLALFSGGQSSLRTLLDTPVMEQSPHAERQFAVAEGRLMTGEWQKARQAVSMAMSSSDLNTQSMTDIEFLMSGGSHEVTRAVIELRSGQMESARRIFESVNGQIDELQRAGVEKNEVYRLKAQVLALTGKPNEAMRALNAALALGWRRNLEAATDPYLESLRGRPDFQRLLKRMADMNEGMRKGAKI